MRKLLFICLLVLVSLAASAQKSVLEETMILQMPTDPGARASSIAWHPTLKRYYAPKSGNASYSMGIFDSKGNLVSPEGLETRFDIRGFWYNPKLRTFCANGYNDNGWATYTLDNDGIPTGITHDVEYMNQPDVHSVGSFDARNNYVYFLKGQHVIAYNASKFDEAKDIRLYINAKDETDAKLWAVLYDEDQTPEDVNYTTVIYTGIPKAEFALLNVEDKTIDFYDMKTGYMTKMSQLPSDAPAESMLCFSYANDIFWLFDINNKMWHGYK
jgi:hypothetical protein